MRRRWSQIAGSAVVLLLTLAVFLVTTQARQGDQPTATPRPATALAAPSSAATPTPTRTLVAANIATTAASASRIVPATATRTPASARATATATAQRNLPITPTPDGKLPTLPFAQLPPEARETIRLIDQGGPFPYDRDGIVFGNRERLLPLQADGYYREYTVITPGSADRGARRVVAGERGELYYTDDHYDSFKRVTR